MKETAGSTGLIQIPLRGDLGLLLNLVVLDTLSPQFSDLHRSVTSPFLCQGRTTCGRPLKPRGTHRLDTTGWAVGQPARASWAERARAPRKTCGHRSPSSIPVRPRWGKKNNKNQADSSLVFHTSLFSTFFHLKIFLNKELPASGRPKPSPTGSQMPGWVEAVSFSHDTLAMGEGTPGSVRGGTWVAAAI